MKRIFVIFLAVLFAPNAVIARDQGDVFPGRCHMGQCNYSRIIEKERVSASPQGELIRIRAQGGTSSDRRKSPIAWVKKSSVIYFYCSASKPAVIYSAEGGKRWSASFLAPGVPDGAAGATTSITMLYVGVCHGIRNQDPWDPAIGRQYGYAASLADRQGQTTLAEPGQIITASPPSQ